MLKRKGKKKHGEEGEREILPEQRVVEHWEQKEETWM
jgi:hypothetical protein